MTRDIFDELFTVIEHRKETLPDDSYTTSLLTHERGRNAILEKLGEEIAELILASKDENRDEIAHESADVIYHVFVLLAAHNLTLDDLREELEARR